MTVPFLDLRPATDEVRADVEHGWATLLDGDQFAGGASVERFETTWAEFCGTSDAVGVSGGASPVYLALRALGLGPGDEVMIAGNAPAATVAAIVTAGCVPRFVDIDASTLLLDTESLADAVNTRSVAVVAVHVNGLMPNMDALFDTASAAGLVVVEEATEAPGARWLDRRAGSSSRVGCFAFEPWTVLGALGGAGAVTTSDPELAAALRDLRDQHPHPAEGDAVRRVGMPSHLDSLQAHVLTAKLPHLEEWISRRRYIAARYRDAAPELRFQREVDGAHGVYQSVVVRVPHRERVRMTLSALGIETRVQNGVPLHTSDPFISFWSSPLPVVEQSADTVLSLPIWPQMTEAQIERVCHGLAVAAEAQDDPPSYWENT